MILTGECKKEFFEWFQSKSQTHYRLKEWFEALDNSMQYGVLVYFFNTKGILISIAGLTLSKTYIFEIGIDKNVEYFECEFKSLKEERTAVIKKANEIYNLK